jgi:GDPmannose 4,6-dehydratase
MSLAKALITGITGQVGSFMAEYLLDKGYEVHGLNRRKSVENNKNIDHILNEIQLIEGDLTDPHCINHVIQAGQYNCIVSLGAQSHVGSSFEQPTTTFEIDAVGPLNILEAIRHYSKHTRLYQASTSELFGKSPPPQNENTPLMPQSPYGCAKLAAHHMVRIYSQAYGLKAACGYMFNTESNRRGDNFVTKKITNWGTALRPALSTNTTLPILRLGNMDAKRDWSHALDSVDAIYRIMYQDEYNKSWDGEWKSYAFGSGAAYSVRDFVTIVLSKVLGNEPFTFVGSGLEEHVLVKGEKVVVVDPKFYRPAEVDYLLCDPTMIKNELGWKQEYTFEQLVDSMLV